MTSVANSVPSFGDRYITERELGRGGMATVYLCTDTKFGRPVAIKLLHPDLAAAVGAERFHREIKIATGLTHPNILPANDSGEAEGSLYYVMPYVTGESLRDRLAREKQLPVDDTVKIVTEVANALQYAHAHGIVHRDIKPENILLESGVAVVADFGIARAITNAADAEALTQTGVSIGTPTYMSPEQAVGEKGVDGRSDQYSLACVMYEMLTGQPPFVAATLQGIIMKHVSEPPPLITTVRHSVPDELEDVILRALEKVPADRFPTIGEFGAALTQVVMQTGTWARRTSTRTSTLKATRRHVVPEAAASRSRHIVTGALSGFAFVALLVGGVFAAKAVGARSPLAAPDIRMREVAVMYFQDESRGALVDVADGVTEALIERLAAVPVLRVRSRNGVLPFRGTDVPPDSIGRVLNVGTVIQGVIEPTQRGGRLVVRYYDVDSRDVVARKAFDFDSASALTLADSLATQVALYLREQVGPQVALRELRNQTSSTEAWTLALRAGRRAKDADSLVIAGASAPALLALSEADSLLARAEIADARWSTAAAQRAAIALARGQALRQNPALPAVLDSGIVRATRAIELDPRNADAFEYRGKLHYMAFVQRIHANPDRHQQALALAEADLNQAVALNPNQAGAWDALSALHYWKPDLNLVSRAASEAYRSDAYLRSTRTILWRLFLANYNQELWTQAMAWLKEFKERFPNDPFGPEGRLYMYRARFGEVDVDSAWIYAEQYVSLSPEAARPLALRKGQMHVAGALANAGLRDSARAVLMRARSDAAIDPNRQLSAIEAAVRVMLGEKDIAVERLTHYLAANPDHRAGFANRTGWWWRGLQGYPPFEALIRGR